MTARHAAKARRFRPALVGVIATRADLLRAVRLRQLPDFFELRLDALLPILAEVESSIPQLRAPLVITARHPREGGKNSLSPVRRGELLQRFLPFANFLDVELRSARQFAPLLRAAREHAVGLIISVHTFDRMPSQRWLKGQLTTALRFRPRMFKLAVRNDTPNDVLRLLAFYTEASRRVPTAAMGIGKCGRSARIALLHHGSAHNYGYLVEPQLSGQISLVSLRRIRRKRKTDRI